VQVVTIWCSFILFHFVGATAQQRTCFLSWFNHLFPCSIAILITYQDIDHYIELTAVCLVWTMRYYCYF